MKDDFYAYDEDNYCYVGKRTKKVFALGDKVLIEIKTADMIKKQLDFLLVDTIEQNASQHNRIEKHEGGGGGRNPNKRNKQKTQKHKGRRR
jgi:DNA-directed RNA polymerase subunit E'/Rpb7